LQISADKDLICGKAVLGRNYDDLLVPLMKTFAFAACAMSIYLSNIIVGFRASP
jgi:hypothetical protein